MRILRSRGLVAVASITVVLAACSSGATASPAASPSAAASMGASPSAAASSGAASPSAAASLVAAKDAKSAAEAGGVDAICTAGKSEGQLNLIATPPDWANYGQMITDFQTKYGIKVNSAQPDADSQTEIDTAKNLKGTGRQPDIFDLGTIVALANTQYYAPYKPTAWDQIPDANKEPTGLWINNYTGYESIGYDAKLGTISTMADLLKSDFKGKVALNGNPLKAAAGFNGVVLASLANGGSADNIAPGVDYFKKMKSVGNLLPVDPTPATIASGQTPIVIDWEYNNAAQTDKLKGKIDWKVVVPTDAPPVASFYNEAINIDAPHPAAARCWVEYVFSTAGQNTWLKGYARPILMPQMVKDGTIDKTALAALAPVSQAPVQLTQAQVAAAKTYLQANWGSIK